MMQFARILTLAALVASPAWADPEDDFARLRDAMPTLLFGNDIALQVQLQSEILRRVEGRWVDASTLMADGIEFPKADLIEKACARSAYTAKTVGLTGLSLTLPSKTKPYVITLHYAGGTTYLSSVDEAGLIARIYPGKAAEDIPPEQLYQTVVSSGWTGYMSVVPAGNDLLLLQPVARPPVLLARCP